ncbi:UNVERIFIED_CONTAM: Ca2+/Na+ antiporter [Brevibacillus sp. OAP136]
MIALVGLSFFAACICLVMLIVSAFKKSGKTKRWGIGTVLCFIIMIIAAVNSPSNENTYASTTNEKNVQQQSSQKPIETQATKSTQQTSSNTKENSSANPKTSDVQESAKKLLESVSDEASNFRDKDNKYVLGVKNGYPENYPDKTYNQAFENFFGNPNWKYFNATTGEKVVEFTGYCTYQNVEVKAKIQFILSTDETSFEVGALSFNDVPQNELTKASLLKTVFETN